MELSVIIPSRDEALVEKTIEDVLFHAESNTEVLVGLDGWSQPISDEDLYLAQFKYKGRVHFLKSVKGIGQRQITNKLVEMSKARYIFKVDSHTSFQQGFDKQMISEMDDRTILAPLMGVLEPISWTINGNKMTSRYCFGKDFVMKYDEENGNPETMTLQGSAWMITKENYFKWGLLDETLGSWGGMAVEVGIKAFLNGVRCRTTRESYYGHVFKEKDSDFGYDRGLHPGKEATELLIKRYRNKSIAGLIEKFNYPADWTPETVKELPSVL